MWLLAESVKRAVEQATHHGAVPSLEQQVEYEARYGYEEGSSPRILNIEGTNAGIDIHGVITKAPSLMATLFGGGNVTYPEIIKALAEADANDAVERITLNVDSPGGHVDGLFDAIAALETTKKPITAVVTNQASSAAYALVSQAGRIEASNRATRVGSVGVVASFSVYEDEVDITSTKAPKKRPDVSTKEGRDMVREELDALHELFVEAIATGRDTTPEKVNADFGQGAVLLADEALKRGMIDAIAKPSLRVVKSSQSTNTAVTGGDNNPEIGLMDLAQLKALHPDVYQAAVNQGIEKERERVAAHLTMGEAANAIDVAVKAIQSGDEYTAKYMAQYNAAALRSRDQQNRDDDEQAAASAASSAAAQAPDAEGDEVLRLVESRLGITEE